MSLPGTICLAIVLAMTLVGGFTRLTHGRYTPRFYAYQLDRAPDNASTWLIPYVDLTMAAMLIYHPTRSVAAMLCSLFQFYGLVMRVKEDKDTATDLACLLCAMVVCLVTLFG